MDIHINEQPLVELGDLIFIGSMADQVYQVIRTNIIVMVEKGKDDVTKEYHRYGLYNMKLHELGRTFRTDVELNQFIAKQYDAITIRKHEDYIWSLRKK